MFSSIFWVLLFHGNRRECLDEPPSYEDIFAPEHYGEVGFARDVCVELGRNLIRKLQLPQATLACQQLALTRTSTCWSFQNCDKWKRDDKNEKVNETVLRRALRMVKDFNDKVSEYPAISNVADQDFIWRSVGIAVGRLIKSGAVNRNSDLIDEIYKLRPNYCPQSKLVTLQELLQKEDEEWIKKEQAKYKDCSKQLDPEETERKRPYLNCKMEEEYEETTIIRDIEIEDGDYYKDEVGQDNKDKIEQDYMHEDEIEQARKNKVGQDSKDAIGHNLKNEIEQDEYYKDGTEQKSSDSEDEQGEFPLHESVFRGNWKKFTKLLDKGYDVTKKDKHGNTATHLAAMLGREEYIELLLDYNPPLRTRNLLGWSAMDEAVSYKNKKIVEMMVPTYNKQFMDSMLEKRRQLLRELEKTEDFYLEMRWEFGCWIPGIAYLMPSDLCKIRKRGSSVRMDTTLAGFEFSKMRYKRGNIAYLFDGKTSPHPTVYFINDDEKEYSKVNMKLDVKNIVEAKDLLNAHIQHVTMSRSSITFKPLINWIRFDKTIGRFKAEYYEVDNMVLKTIKRREHLSQQRLEQIAASVEGMKNFMKEAMKGKEPNVKVPDELKEEDDRVEPVPPCKVTWEQYINSAPKHHPTLARPLVLEESSGQIKTTIGMSPQLKLPVDTFMKIIEVIAPLRHFDKVREFLQMKLPEGFPVKLEIPIIPTLSARITFPEFKYWSELNEKPFPEHLFQAPVGYKST